MTHNLSYCEITGFFVILYTVLPSVDITNVSMAGLHTLTQAHIHSLHFQIIILNNTGWESVMLSGEREGSRGFEVEHSLHRCSCAS